jgi:crossover junction endodeoxyribonuclease RuvC
MGDTPDKERIILGIDPGTTNMGYGLIKGIGRNPSMIALGFVELSGFADHYLKLQRIFERTLQLIDQYHPDELAIEAPFHGKNVQSMLKLGRAQGVAIAAGLYRSLPIFEYAPLRIKQAITGQGNASKEQVALMLQRILEIDRLPDNLDATDGLAAALCHFYQNDLTKGKNKSKGWKEFMANNPDRVG